MIFIIGVVFVVVGIVLFVRELASNNDKYGAGIGFLLVVVIGGVICIHTYVVANNTNNIKYESVSKQLVSSSELISYSVSVVKDSLGNDVYSVQTKDSSGLKYISVGLTEVINSSEVNKATLKTYHAVGYRSDFVDVPWSIKVDHDEYEILIPAPKMK